MHSCQNSFNLFFSYLGFSIHNVLALPEMGRNGLCSISLRAREALSSAPCSCLFYSSHQYCTFIFLELCCCFSSQGQHYKLKGSALSAALATLLTDVCFSVTVMLEEGVPWTVLETEALHF